MSGSLMIVSTPIGNLEDITFRAINVLKSVSTIYAEDTRQTLKIMRHYQIETPLLSLHEHNEKSRIEEIKAKLDDGLDVALVSDAGTPRISDPGDLVVKELIEAGYKIVPIPGASAIMAALVTAPFNLNEFTFFGFIPHQNKKQKELFDRIKHYPGVLVFYEAPHRVNATLKTLFDHLGPRVAVTARELTKIYETIDHFTLSEQMEIAQPKGEYVIMVKGFSGTLELPEDYLEHVDILISDGWSEKDAIKEVASLRKIPKNTVYMAVQNAKKGA
jgi:16S rRNA (cytidine1402-2'-O)-methyltransferase